MAAKTEQFTCTPEEQLLRNYAAMKIRLCKLATPKIVEELEILLGVPAQGSGVAHALSRAEYMERTDFYPRVSFVNVSLLAWAGEVDGTDLKSTNWSEIVGEYIKANADLISKVQKAFYRDSLDFARNSLDHLGHYPASHEKVLALRAFIAIPIEERAAAGTLCRMKHESQAAVTMRETRTKAFGV